MKILAADTTTSINTVALCDGGHVLAETFVDCGRAHSERLLATVDWVLNEAKQRLEDVEVLAIAIGPGSFTGLRVGAATWKGLAAANALPLVAVPTLDAMTRLSAFHDALVCPLLDARMGEVFGAVYRFEQGVRSTLRPDRVAPVEAVLEGIDEPLTLLGDGIARYRERVLAVQPSARILPERYWGPRASAVAAEALELLDNGVEMDPALAVPVYLRKSQAEEQRNT